MYKEITESDFANDPTIRESFSYRGAIALFEYLEEIENIEFDPVAFRCEFTEYADYDELAEVYWDLKECETDDDKREWLLDRTMVIEFDGGVIIADF